MNGEDDPGPEAVIDTAGVLACHQTGFGHQIECFAVTFGCLCERVPARGRKPKLKLGGHLARQAPLFEVSDRLGRHLMLAQLLFKEAVCICDSIEQGGSQCIFRSGRPGIRYLKTSALGEFFDGFSEAEVFKLHQEADGAAVRATAKTVVKLFGLTDGKRRGFFVMEWATGLKVPARLGQRHPCIDQFDDVGTGKQFVDKLSWNSAAHRLSHRFDHRDISIQP